MATSQATIPILVTSTVNCRLQLDEHHSPLFTFFCNEESKSNTKIPPTKKENGRKIG